MKAVAGCQLPVVGSSDNGQLPTDNLFFGGPG